MIKIENVEVMGWKAAIRGMRNPKNSWDKSDTIFCDENGCGCCRYDSMCKDREDWGDNFSIGPNDLKLMQTLIKAGSVHRKFMRMITVYCDITASHTWWAEFDTYKVATVRNSCSKMHKIHVKEFVKDDFDHEGIDACNDIGMPSLFNTIVEHLEIARLRYNKTQDKKYWRAIIELLPMGYHIKATVELNYETLLNMYQPDNRRYHKLDEWCVHNVPNREYFTDYGFCDFIENLPYAKELIMC